MQYPIIKTDNYLLVVSDELLEIGDWCYGENINTKGYKIDVHEAGSHDLHNKHPKIKAHLPLNNSPYLDGVDVLPEIENEVEKLAEKSWGDKISSTYYAYIEGYNKRAETHKYTEKQLDDAISWATINARKGDITVTDIDNFIQSLNQPKLPVSFECEMENHGYCEGCRRAGMWHCAHADTCGNAETRQRPKTITNSQGKTEWMGKYIYE